MAKKKQPDKVVKLEKKRNGNGYTKRTPAPAQKEVQGFNGTISKVKLKKEIPEIWFKVDGARSTRDIKLTAKEKPLDEFSATLQNLKGLLCNVCEIEEKSDYMTVLGVSFSKTGVVISGTYQLVKNGIKCPVPINTPHIVFDSKGAGYEIPEDEQEKIEEFKAAVIRYVNGETAEKQTTLDFLEAK